MPARQRPLKPPRLEQVPMRQLSRPLRTLPDWVAYSVAGGIVLTISSIHLAFGPLAALRPAFLLLVAALFGLYYHNRAWRPEDAARSRMFQMIAVMFVIAVIGVPFAVVSGRALTMITDHFVKSIVTGLMVWGLCRHGSHRLTIMRATTLGFFIAAVWALIAQRGSSDGRLAGAAQYDANSLALVAVVLLPLLVWYALDPRNRWRWAGLLALPLPLLILVRTNSRGGYLALAAIALGTAFLYRKRAPRSLRRLLPITVVLGIAGLPFIPESALERFRAISDGSDYNLTAETGRVEIWKRGIGYAVANPILGVGIDNFSSAEGFSDAARQASEEGRGFKWKAAHNMYVQALAELGFIGGGAFIYLIFRTIWDLFQRAAVATRTRDPDGVLVGLLAVALAGYSASAIFMSWGYNPHLYIMWGIAYGYLDAPGSPTRAREVPRRGRTRRPRPQPAAGVPAAYRLAGGHHR